MLGNLTTEKGKVHQYLKESINDIVALFGMYAEMLLEDSNNKDEHSHRFSVISKESQDLLTKLVRLIANLAIDPSCGDELVKLAEMELLVAIIGNE